MPSFCVRSCRFLCFPAPSSPHSTALLLIPFPVPTSVSIWGHLWLILPGRRSRLDFSHDFGNIPLNLNMRTTKIFRKHSLIGPAAAFALFLHLPQAVLSADAPTESPKFNTRFEGDLTGEAPPPENPLTLWYRRPATEWVQALAIGNGRVGAMVFGGIDHERLQLNEGTLWAGGPYDPNNPEALAALPEARRLVFAAKYQEAD